MTNNDQKNNDAVLKEILLLPSNKTITDRFCASAKTESANCSGKCVSGVCRTFV